MTEEERFEWEHHDAPAVYLIHFDQAYHHARHYLGQAKDLHLRLAEHRSAKKRAARLIQVLAENHITWTLARVWKCDTQEEARALEKRLKRQKHNPRFCPICQGEA